jgi:flagellar brake protein
VPQDKAPKPQNLDDYRISSLVEIQDLFRQMVDKRALITLSGPGGSSYTTLMWSADMARGLICLSGSDADPRLDALLATDEVVAMAYLDNIKVQFDVEDIVKVQGGEMALNARYPREVFRFQRRSFFRVKPLLSTSPVARISQPTAPHRELALRILDISLGGVALSMPPNEAMLPVGVTLRHCLLELDTDTHLDVDLVVHHVTVLNPELQAARLGCEILGLQGDDERALHHYINQTQKRRHALTP